MTILIEPLASSDEAIALLFACKLPTADVATSPTLQLFGHRIDSQLVGTVGLERYPPLALLRSLAVQPAHRGSGIARALVVAAEKHATSVGAHALYLLTETAERFFAKLGYVAIDRAHAPPAIATCTEFTNLCPASARLMRKTLVSSRAMASAAAQLS